MERLPTESQSSCWLQEMCVIILKHLIIINKTKIDEFLLEKHVGLVQRKAKVKGFRRWCYSTLIIDFIL